MKHINTYQLLTTVHEGELITEEWASIPNYEGLYEVSTFGRVKSLSREVIRSNGRPKYVEGKMLSPYLNSDGYPTVSLCNNGIRKTRKVHKLVASVFLGHKRQGMEEVVDHIDNDRTNNFRYNLQLITNRLNGSKDRKNKTSKYTGVYLDKRNNKWKSRINLIGSTSPLHLGVFECEDEAGQQYKNALEYILQNNLKDGDITAKELRKQLKTEYHDGIIT